MNKTKITTSLKVRNIAQMCNVSQILYANHTNGNLSLSIKIFKGAKSNPQATWIRVLLALSVDWCDGV